MYIVIGILIILIIFILMFSQTAKKSRDSAASAYYLLSLGDTLIDRNNLEIKEKYFRDYDRIFLFFDNNPTNYKNISLDFYKKWSNSFDKETIQQINESVFSLSKNDLIRISMEAQQTGMPFNKHQMKTIYLAKLMGLKI